VTAYKHVFMLKYDKPEKRSQHMARIMTLSDQDFHNVHMDVHGQFHRADPGDQHEELLGRLLDRMNDESDARVKRDQGVNDYD
jgi:hypothetical protein